LAQRRYDEAEPLLIAGYEGLMQQRNQIESFSQHAPAVALQRVIQLYQQWNKPAEAQRWKNEIN